MAALADAGRIGTISGSEQAFVPPDGPYTTRPQEGHVMSNQPIPSRVDCQKLHGMIKDISGQRFGRLEVIRYVAKSKWLCRCDCGATAISASFDLRRGHTQSCGCLNRERTGNTSRRHGRTGTRLYNIWNSMRQRCNDSRHKRYHRYGGRGIKVCERWNDFATFAADVGESPDGVTIDRIDNNGNYEPGNVRWTTYTTNNRNRADNHIIELNGERRCMTEWIERLGLKPWKVYRRLKKGWPVEVALTHPGPSTKLADCPMSLLAERKDRRGIAIEPR